jgi:predicted transcriptional regulator
MVRKLVDLVFDGSARRLVAHLLESDELSDRERQEFRQWIDIELQRGKQRQ